jgi:hypothetical protein
VCVLAGVVDSDDLPLNVNREQLAQSKVLKLMGKKLTRKALHMIHEMTGEKDRKKEDEEEKQAELTEEEKKEIEEKKVRHTHHTPHTSQMRDPSYVFQLPRLQTRVILFSLV